MGASNEIGKAADRRKYIRIPYEAVIRYKSCPAKGAKKKAFLDASSKNISSGGILMATKERFPQGTIMEVELDVPSLDGYSTVKILGQIVRTREVEKGKRYENGMSFYKIDEQDSDVLDQFLEFFPEMEIVEN
jgi:c-di-GMP-binding flagellar brake protein YcgR